MIETSTTHLPVLTRAVLCRLAEQGTLSASAWNEALEYLGFRPTIEKWGFFGRQVLLLAGLMLLTAGLVFFVAANWAEMQRFHRLALVQAVVACTGLAAVWRGPDSLAGRLCLLACGICVGPMLAVFGQNYQSGAGLWELFRLWACVLFFLALAGRQAALWLTFWIVSSILIMLYMGQSFTHPLSFFTAFPSLAEYLLAQVLGLMAWEAAAHTTRNSAQQHWLRARWLPRLLFVCIMALLTARLCILVVFGQSAQWALAILYLPPEETYWLLYAFCLCGAWLWYRRYMPDLFMLACCISSLATLLVALLLRAEMFIAFDLFDLSIWVMVIIGLTWAAVKILLHLQKQMNQQGDKAITATQEQAGLISSWTAGTRWLDVWPHLRRCNLVAQESPPLPVMTTTPWYIHLMLIFSAWVVALLCVFSLALLLLPFLGLHRDITEPLLLGGIAFMGVAWKCLQAPSFFICHLGFALALAGSAAVGIAFCLLGESSPHWALLASLPFLAGMVILRNSLYRFLAALCVSVFISLWLDTLLLEDIPHYSFDTSTPSGPIVTSLFFIANTLWWAFIACAIALICAYEDRWRCLPHNKKTPEMFTSLALGAFAGLLLMPILTLYYRCEDIYWLHITASEGPTGIGAGFGFICLIFCITKKVQCCARYCFLGAMASLVLLLSWYLPGVSIALLGMALARYMANSLLLGATGCFLFAYIIYYYYTLDLTFMEKSLTLIAAGGVLLLAGWTIRALTQSFASGGEGHA